jgi:hypothetical protein
MRAVQRAALVNLVCGLIPAQRFRAGTRAPLRRASLKPIAMACLRLFTLPPLPPLPLRRVPRFRRRMALSTARLAPLL